MSHNSAWVEGFLRDHSFPNRKCYPHMCNNNFTSHIWRVGGHLKLIYIFFLFLYKKWNNKDNLDVTVAWLNNLQNIWSLIRNNLWKCISYEQVSSFFTYWLLKNARWWKIAPLPGMGMMGTPETAIRYSPGKIYMCPQGRLKGLQITRFGDVLYFVICAVKWAKIYSIFGWLSLLFH